MQLQQLRYFTTICSFQSISKAADHLHISQPSLSAAVRDLEQEFGVTLFTRHYRGVRLTPEGQALHRFATDLLARADQTAAAMKDLGSGRKVLRLGVPPMIGSLILPRIYRDFSPPGISLEITEGGSHQLQRQLTEKELDLAFLSHTGTPDPATVCLHAAALDICCCAASTDPLDSTVPITPAQLAEQPMVLFENSFLQTELILQWFHRANVSPDILLQTRQLSTMVRMLESGCAVGFLFRELIDSNPNLKAVATREPLQLQVSLARLSGQPVSQAMDAFWTYIKSENPFQQEKHPEC